MKTSLAEGRVRQVSDAHVAVEVTESGATFFKKRDANGKPFGLGQFFMRLSVTALQQAVYVPLSLASGKKPTGFVYHIEGTAAGALSAAQVSSTGEGVTKLTVGTLLYAKIPQGSAANFRFVVDIKGELGKEYKIGISRINYKLNPSDARYKKLDTALNSKTLKFK